MSALRERTILIAFSRQIRHGSGAVELLGEV
jgi:hypothetical protein